MESIREQLVKKPRMPEDNVKKIIVLVGALVVAIVVLSLILSLGNAFMTELGIFIALGILWGGWQLSGRFNIEYEYIVVGAEVQIDKIINKRSRKTLCSFNLRKAKAFYRSEHISNDETEINACGEGDRFTIEYDDERLGKTVLVFTPDERTLEMITPYLPRAI